MTPLITEQIPLFPLPPASLDHSKPHSLNLFHFLFVFASLSGFLFEKPPKLWFR
ncbi:MAG: hypothetical protein NTX04_07620 [Verrucomicrobia bacterium]|nr:hypothetical protein [Verrucomicrobiota bacterium]